MYEERSILGVMSGSSLDGLDLALCKFSGEPNHINWDIVKTECVEIPQPLRLELQNLAKKSAFDLARADFDFAYFIGDACNKFLSSEKTDFIASHGHTIFHFPEEKYTCQIGNGAAISARTNLPVICDFRSADIAAGGQGAPIVSTFDSLLFGHMDALINLGGIANITVNMDDPIAFDLCPCNQLLNHLAIQEGRDYDENGEMASRGSILVPLLDELMKSEYLQRKFPKTLDNSELSGIFFPVFDTIDASTHDKLRTAIEFVVLSVEKEIEKLFELHSINLETVMLTGGGAHNKFLNKLLSQKMPGINWIVPEKEFVDFKEAVMIAFLGYLRLLNEPNVFASATGADRNTINGAIYNA